MSAKHTPGPWSLDRRSTCWAIVDAKGQDLAYQDDAPRFHDGEPCGSVTSRGRTSKDLEANARLIAAAPDLLAALELAESSLSTYATTGAFTPGQPSGWLLAQLRLAIARATTP